MPDRVSPQLATLVSAPPTGKGWAYEIKFDGYRILARCERGEARLFTRNGNDWTTKMETLARQVSLLPAKTAWLDGEVVVLGDNGLPKFNALQNAFDSAGTEHIVYFVFDLLYLDGKDLRTLDLSSRRAALEDLFADYDQGRVRLRQAFDREFVARRLRRRSKIALCRKRRHGLGFGHRHLDATSAGEARSL